MCNDDNRIEVYNYNTDKQVEDSNINIGDKLYIAYIKTKILNQETSEVWDENNKEWKCKETYTKQKKGYVVEFEVSGLVFHRYKYDREIYYYDSLSEKSIQIDNDRVFLNVNDAKSAINEFAKDCDIILSGEIEVILC